MAFSVQEQSMAVEGHAFSTAACAAPGSGRVCSIDVLLSLALDICYFTAACTAHRRVFLQQAVL
jgi:hypothetical protein